jgi:hypothetical protein
MIAALYQHLSSRSDCLRSPERRSYQARQRHQACRVTGPCVMNLHFLYLVSLQVQQVPSSVSYQSETRSLGLGMGIFWLSTFVASRPSSRGGQPTTSVGVPTTRASTARRIALGDRTQPLRSLEMRVVILPATWQRESATRVNDVANERMPIRAAVRSRPRQRRAALPITQLCAAPRAV